MNAIKFYFEQVLRQDKVFFDEIPRPKKYLFEGQNGGQYAIRSVQDVFKNAMQKVISIRQWEYMDCGTVTPRIYWKVEPICTLSKNYWDTRI